MSLKKFFILSIIITVFSLAYIQMQVSIYDFAYRGKYQEDQVFKLADGNTQATVNIAKLKSAQHLGEWFFNTNNNVDFVNSTNIVDVQASASELAKVNAISLPAIAKRSENLFDRVFGLKSVAEAKPIR